ncbi:MAG: hypothetical protein PHR66_11010 [Desulfuromonadaceae bacterium]|nr:hypothetical protein [Desulfuromonadaceae bacterium]
MRNSLRMMPYMLYALLIFALSGCGATGTTAGMDSSTANGKLTANLVLPKSTGKTVGSAADVVTTRLKVTGATIPTATKDFANSTGGSLEVYPGSDLIVTAQAFDTNGVMIYEGFATSVTVVAGQPQTVSIQLNAPTVKATDTSCIACHDSTRDITGQNLVADYKQSGHYTNIDWTTNTKNGSTLPGCAGCHGTNHNDLSPAASGRCFECHGTLGPKHTNTTANLAGEANAARYLNAANNNCSACHEPHNPINGAGKDERKAWAESGHGDVSSPAWTDYKFATYNSYGSDYCNRCHTARGFVQAQNSNFAVTSHFTDADAEFKRPLTCDACHTDNKFTMRQGVQFTAKYNGGNSQKTFPNVGTSNLCIACHTGLESGDAIATSTDNFSNKGAVGSHYMAAAGLMYMASPFINFTTLTAPAPSNNEGSAFTSTKTYAKNNLPDSASVPAFGITGGTSSAHRRIGTPLITGTETYLGQGTTPTTAQTLAISSNGPCVSCHLQADNAIAGDTPENMNVPVPAFRPGKGHSLQIDQAAAQQICLPCHGEQHLDGGDGNGNPIYTATVSLATLQSAMLEPQSKCYQDGLALLSQILEVKYMIKYDPAAYPYFFDIKAGGTAIVDWTRINVAGVTDAAVAAFGSATLTPIPAGGLTQAQAKKLMGACFNLGLMYKDPAGYLHARTFVQRLVYDSLDFLDNNSMDFTSLTSARVLNPTIYHGTNVNVRASDGTLATESMIWLSGTHYNDPGAIAGVGTLLKPMKLHP